jgi:hypothetical protein
MRNVKAVLILLTSLLAITSTFGQGRVTFRNGASTNYYIYTNGPGGLGLMSGVDAYRIGLYASPNTGASAGSLTLIGLATNAAALPGRFLGPAPYFITAPGYTAGQPITFQIRAWSFAAGLTYEEALLGSVLDPLNVHIGTSVLGTTTPTPAPSPAGELWGTSPGNLTSGFVINVPEPSTTALLGLGAVAFLLSVRRGWGKGTLKR